jgi:hypothetical protein
MLATLAPPTLTQIQVKDAGLGNDDLHVLRVALTSQLPNPLQVWGYPLPPRPVNREPCGRVIPVPPEELAAEADMQQRIDQLAKRVRFRRAGGLTEEEKAVAEAEAKVGTRLSSLVWD